MDFTDLNSGGSVISFDNYNNDAFNNLASQGNSIQQTSNEIALDSPFGRDSVFYEPDYAEEHIDFPTLINFLKEGKDTIFDYRNFIGISKKDVKKTLSHGKDAIFDRMAGNSTSITVTEIYNEEKPITDRLASRYLQLDGKLNKETGVINLKKDSEDDVTVGLDFEFDPLRRKVSYKLYFYYVRATRYVVEEDSKGEIAVIITSSVYDDFEELLKLCGRTSNSNFKNKIKNAFLDALKETEELEDKVLYNGYRKEYNNVKFFRLNWLYQYIPRFVAQELDFCKTLGNVFKLSKFDRKDGLGNDTTSGVTGILTKLNPVAAYEHFYNNPDDLIELYSGFDDENSIKEFCTYFTALTFLIAGEDIKPRTFTVSEDGNAHIESNILFGDEEGKVKITNELQLPVVGFDSLSIFRYLFGKDIEINNPDNESNQFHPLDIIYIKKLDSDLNEVETIPTIALYGKYLGDTSEWSDVTDAALAVVDVIGIITSGGALSAGIRGAARLFAILDVAVSTINLGMAIPGAKGALSKTEAGKWFVTHWGLLSFCVSMGTISYYLAKGIVKYGAKFKEQLKNKKLAKQIDDLIEESKKVVNAADISNVKAIGTGGFIEYLSVLSRNMFGQEDSLSCAVACIRQLAKDRNIIITEEKIRKFGNIVKGGPTYEKQMVAASEKIFKNKSFGEGILEHVEMPVLDLSHILSENGSWVAWVKNRETDRIFHAIIIDKIENGFVYVRDPWPINGIKGIDSGEPGVEAYLKLDEFEKRWNLSNRYAFWFKN
ncbi:hypothetical protein GCM10007424_26420 [Flavobacterium suaedae]|uniref:Peptidase C39 domain-containing protein n=1 Tax=Flavobacterium suaedae TaxID=1767027 RepID=A0ABQ1K4G0_9FLAO|nr:hypothetical protein [Flavobacterium suaedae]GGB85088.1 hypothetical protein GCM10007424_26420 [Flavobacterium suaedae]